MKSYFTIILFFIINSVFCQNILNEIKQKQKEYYKEVILNDSNLTRQMRKDYKHIIQKGHLTRKKVLKKININLSAPYETGLYFFESSLFKNLHGFIWNDNFIIQYFYKKNELKVLNLKRGEFYNTVEAKMINYVEELEKNSSTMNISKGRVIGGVFNIGTKIKYNEIHIRAFYTFH